MNGIDGVLSDFLWVQRAQRAVPDTFNNSVRRVENIIIFSFTIATNIL